jgi:hypothetical protein
VTAPEVGAEWSLPVLDPGDYRITALCGEPAAVIAHDINLLDLIDRASTAFGCDQPAPADLFLLQDIAPSDRPFVPTYDGIDLQYDRIASCRLS